ncbi:DUF2256 domain-containing protein [Pantoea dispersa]
MKWERYWYKVQYCSERCR